VRFILYNAIFLKCLLLLNKPHAQVAKREEKCKNSLLEYAVVLGYKYTTKTQCPEIGIQCSWFSGIGLYLSGTYVMPLWHSHLFTQVVSCKNKLSSIPGLCYMHSANVLLNPCSLKLLFLLIYFHGSLVSGNCIFYPGIAVFVIHYAH